MAHSAKVKAQALAAMLTGEGVREVSRRYGIPKSTVSRWRQEEVLPILRGLNIRLPRLATQWFRSGHKKRKPVHDIDPT